ncbi:hypothetical protein ASPZODRAFT_39420, partial [Penicilliopsis zonata CBS 506.65]
FRGPPSAFMGPPTPEIDAEWYHLAKIFNFGVDYPVLKALNRTQGAIKYPGTGVYQAGMEVFHQLHCLNYIRMYTYQDHYGNTDYDMIGETPEERQRHKDHCIENIRQRLMCAPDLNVYTYHWLPESTLPHGHLFTRHQCVEWDSFYAWAENSAINSPPLSKPNDAETL